MASARAPPAAAPPPALGRRRMWRAWRPCAGSKPRSTPVPRTVSRTSMATRARCRNSPPSPTSTRRWPPPATCCMPMPIRSSRSATSTPGGPPGSAAASDSRSAQGTSTSAARGRGSHQGASPIPPIPTTQLRPSRFDPTQPDPSAAPRSASLSPPAAGGARWRGGRLRPDGRRRGGRSSASSRSGHPGAETICRRISPSSNRLAPAPSAAPRPAGARGIEGSCWSSCFILVTRAARFDWARGRAASERARALPCARRFRQLHGPPTPHSSTARPRSPPWRR